MAFVDKMFKAMRSHQKKLKQKQIDAEYAVYQRALTKAENALNRPYFSAVKSPKGAITDPSEYIRKKINELVDIVAEKVDEGVDVRVAEPLEALFEEVLVRRGYAFHAIITDYNTAEKLTWYSVAKNQAVLDYRESKR